jgi:hypothetical protein
LGRVNYERNRLKKDEYGKAFLAIAIFASTQKLR